jgi:hypothetical protein
MCNAIEEVHLSASRVELTSDDTEREGRQSFEIYEYFSLQLDLLTDVCDVSQLLVFIRIAFDDGSIKEELLKTIRYRKPRLTAMGIRCAEHATHSIRNSWH